MNTVLERKPVEIAEDTGFFESFCEEVQGKLGYSMPRNLGDENLRQALVDLGIKPFDPKSVEAYKKGKTAARLDRAMEVQFFSGLAFLIGSLVVCLVVNVLAAGPFVFWPVYGVIAGVVATLSSVVIASVFAKNLEWESVRLESYRQEIPLYALQTALDIKEKCPESGFFVDSLVRQVDPFLYVRGNGEAWDSPRYYLEVWNEPGFDKKKEE